MKELKFTCPSCGQHIQCDASHAGENVPCPGCASLIRVPPGGELTEVPSVETAPDSIPPLTENSEKVSYAPMQFTGSIAEKKSPAPSSNRISEPSSDSPKPTIGASDKKHSAIDFAAHSSELHCVCPVCQAPLKISITASPNSDGALNESPREKESVSTSSSSEHLSPSERDQKIAAAREAHPVSAYPTIKPRLDQILGNNAPGSSAHHSPTEPSPFEKP